MKPACLACIASGVATASSAQTSIRYDFSLEAVNNTTAVTAPDSAFADVPLGAKGMVSIEASTTPFGGGVPGPISLYPILATSGSVAGIDLALDQTRYPSIFAEDTLGILDFDQLGVGSMGAQAFSLRPDLGLVFFQIASEQAALWGEGELPRSIDLTASGVEAVLELNAPNQTIDSGRLVMRVTGVDIILIPGHATSCALVLAATAFVRRRR